MLAANCSCLHVIEAYIISMLQPRKHMKCTAKLLHARSILQMKSEPTSPASPATAAATQPNRRGRTCRVQALYVAGLIQGSMGRFPLLVAPLG